MFDQKYILNDAHELVPVDLMTWGAWFETADRTVAKTNIGGKLVSTVFLGMDHRFGDAGPPLLFETMIFPEGSLLEEYCERYSTWDDAVEGHKRAVESVPPLQIEGPTDAHQ